MNISPVNPYLNMPGSFTGSSYGLGSGGSLLGGSGSLLSGGMGDSFGLSGMGGLSGMSGMGGLSGMGGMSGMGGQGGMGGILGMLMQMMQMISTMLSMIMGGGGMGDMLGGGAGGYGDPTGGMGGPGGAGGGSPYDSSGGGGSSPEYGDYGGGGSQQGGGGCGGAGGGRGHHGHGGGAGGPSGSPGGGDPAGGYGGGSPGGPSEGGGTPTPAGDSNWNPASTPSSTPGARPGGNVTQGDASSYAGGAGVSGSKSSLPPIDPSQWTARDGQNPGSEFTTPFVSGNVHKGPNSISTKIQGGQGSEARLNKTIGTGFYQVNVNPQTSNQLGEMSTFFLYSNTGTSGGEKQQGFELDAEYNMVRNNSVTFGTWIDGQKYNEVTIDAPKGDQTIGFNIQEGKTQIGYVNPDGSFQVVSETKDPRITKELASHLVPMSNSWRFKDKGGTSQEGSSITINGFGRSDAPGQAVKPV